MLINHSFSIAIPVTRADYIVKTLGSCFSQRYENFEVIVSINTNDEATRTKVKKIINGFNASNLRYFENENQLSLIKNWNKLLWAATCEYFTLLSDDDYLDDKFLTEFNQLINKYPNTWVFHCRLREVDENNNLIGISPLCPEFENVENFIWHRVFGYRKQYISDFVFNTKKFSTGDYVLRGKRTADALGTVGGEVKTGLHFLVFIASP